MKFNALAVEFGVSTPHDDGGMPQMGATYCIHTGDSDQTIVYGPIGRRFESFRVHRTF